MRYRACHSHICNAVSSMTANLAAITSSIRSTDATPISSDGYDPNEARSKYKYLRKHETYKALLPYRVPLVYAPHFANQHAAQGRRLLVPIARLPDRSQPHTHAMPIPSPPRADAPNLPHNKKQHLHGYVCAESH